MTIQEPVGIFKFGTNTIEADLTGAFTIKLENGGEWRFDLGEMQRLIEIIQSIQANGIKPTIDTPKIFWRTNGTKIIEVFIGKGILDSPDRIYLREGGNKTGYFLVKESDVFLKNFWKLSENAPYHRIVKLVDVIEERKDETIIRIDQFPINNRNGQTNVKVEKEFSQEILRTMSVEAKFGLGIDYWISVNLEAKFSMANQQRISETVKVTMEVLPGEHKIYLISWKEITTIGTGIFEINGAKQKVPFKIKSGITPEIKQEIIT